jgi:hypothetical protein
MTLSHRDAALALISEELPYRGPCGICGAIDARHRLIDAVTGRLAAGESVYEVAWDYGLCVGTIEAMRGIGYEHRKYLRLGRQTSKSF